VQVRPPGSFAAAAAAAVITLATPAAAQTSEQFYAGRNIDFVIGYPPGGSKRESWRSLFYANLIYSFITEILGKEAMNEGNFEDGAHVQALINAGITDILLPRAVGYAAGFLDTFFRGSVGGVFEQQNLTISGATEVMDGTFRVLYDTDDGTRRELASWTLRIEPDSTSPALPTPTLPADAAPGMPCWLIFRGQLGLEPDAVAGTRIACPSTTPEPPPPSGGPWVVYYCATFISSQNYLYATTDPPLDGLAPDNLFVYFQVSTNTSFNCGIKAIHVATPPPNARTEHPL